MDPLRELGRMLLVVGCLLVLVGVAARGWTDSMPRAVRGVKLEVADRKFGIVDVIVKRIEFGFVQNVVLCEFGVKPLECIEILTLVGVVKGPAEVEVLQAFLYFGAKLPLRLGKLPGDILHRGEHTTFYFPIVTCLVLSLGLSLLFWLFSHFRR